MKIPSKAVAEKFANKATGWGAGIGLGAGALALGIGAGTIIDPSFRNFAESEYGQGDGGLATGLIKSAPVIGLAAAVMFRKPLSRAFTRMTGAGPNGGIGGMAQGAINLGMGLGKAAMGVVQDIERFGIRPLLTGKGPYSRARDAYFPFFGTKSGLNPERLALNPTVTRRLMMGGVGIGALATANEVARPTIAPPSVYYDGTGMRHVNDMGMNHTQAQNVLGPNSSLNPSNMLRNQMISM